MFPYSVPGNSCMLSATGRCQYGTKIRKSVELLEQKDHVLEQMKHARQRTEIENKNLLTPVRTDIKCRAYVCTPIFVVTQFA